MDAEVKQAIYEVEQSLIGAILIRSEGGDRTCIDELQETLRPEEFFFEFHRRIYTAMLRTKLAPELRTVVATMHEQDLLKPGDLSQIANCISVCPCSLDFDYYALALKKHWETLGRQTTNQTVRGAK